MKNVAPSRALARRGRQLLQLSFFVGASGLFFVALGATLQLIRLLPPEDPGFDTYITATNISMIFGGLSIIVAIGLAIYAITMRKDNPLAQRVGDYLNEINALDDGYWFIRNVSKLGLGYIDAVIVGPPGVLIFRILDKTGDFLNEGDRWLKAGEEGEWVPAGFDATRDTVVDVKAARKYLAKNDLPDVPVFGVVVFIPDDPHTRLTLKKPLLPATHMKSMMTRLEKSYFAKTRIDPQTTERIIKLFYSL